MENAEGAPFCGLITNASLFAGPGSVVILLDFCGRYSEVFADAVQSPQDPEFTHVDNFLLTQFLHLGFNSFHFTIPPIRGPSANDSALLTKYYFM
jgi:hypothetical protein